MTTFALRCKNCGWQIFTTNPEPIRRCARCGNEVNPNQEQSEEIAKRAEAYQQRRSLCRGCKFMGDRGCGLYLKPCTTESLWRDQIDPPTQCPKYDEFVAY